MRSVGMVTARVPCRTLEHGSRIPIAVQAAVRGARLAVSRGLAAPTLLDLVSSEALGVAFSAVIETLVLEGEEVRFVVHVDAERSELRVQTDAAEIVVLRAPPLPLEWVLPASKLKAVRGRVVFHTYHDRSGLPSVLKADGGASLRGRVFSVPIASLLGQR